MKLLFYITIKLINKSYNHYIKVTVFSLLVDDKAIIKRFKNPAVFLNKMTKKADFSAISEDFCMPLECYPKIFLCSGPVNSRQAPDFRLPSSSSPILILLKEITL